MNFRDSVALTLGSLVIENTEIREKNTILAQENLELKARLVDLEFLNPQNIKIEEKE